MTKKDMSVLEWAEKEVELEEGLATAKDQDRQTARQALSDHIIAGAVECEDCGTLPHGMKKNPSTYEVGCVTCPTPKRARAGTAQGAVLKWNRGELVKEASAA